MSASPESAPKAPVVAGDIVAGKYRIVQPLGAGGMGLVFVAEHVSLGQRVAMKFLAADPRDKFASDRFAREAQIAAELTCEQVPRVVDFGFLPDGTSYMVMEYLVGLDLDEVVAQRGRVPFTEAVDLVVQACVAVAEAHSRGVVHRDLKPSNLFLTQRPDGSPLVKVLDFGISKRTVGADIRLTSTGSALGSPLYMSPEQCRDTKNVDARTDIWSLGTVVYELVTGKAPFDGESIHESISKIAADPPPSIQSLGAYVPPPLEAVLVKCLAKRREDRYQTVAELAVALAPFASPAAQAYVSRVCGSLDRSGSSPTMAASTGSQLPSARRSSAAEAARTAAAWQTSTNEGGRHHWVGVSAAIVGVSVVLALVGGALAWKALHRGPAHAQTASAQSGAPASAPPLPTTLPAVDGPAPAPAAPPEPTGSPLPEVPPRGETRTGRAHDAGARPATPIGPGTARKAVDPKSPPGLDDPSLRAR